MTAHLTLRFEDGSTKEIPLTHVFELDLAPERRQSISFNETSKGFVMSITRPILEGKKLAKEFLEVHKCE